jgi:hypothetical protein
MRQAFGRGGHIGKMDGDVPKSTALSCPIAGNTGGSFNLVASADFFWHFPPQFPGKWSAEALGPR